eukprot:11012342-Ditylum_brightwellii.AAC.1
MYSAIRATTTHLKSCGTTLVFLTDEDKGRQSSKNMKIKTLQILWHNGCQNNNGKKNPFLSCSLLDSGWCDDRDISSHNEEDRYEHVLPTSSSTSETHLWKIIFNYHGGNNGNEGSNTTTNNVNGKNSSTQPQRSLQMEYTSSQLVTMAVL